ncbi:hypothetical protein Ciccas_009498 [Cichlidogyrus casuarinus]|uniref:Uncharacterized protein n=1 Tax=Cichlidogyrus casuarinus TaxID=1844966 RepID=A0ABD2PYA6_9PLAT
MATSPREKEPSKKKEKSKREQLNQSSGSEYETDNQKLPGYAHSVQYYVMQGTKTPEKEKKYV